MSSHFRQTRVSPSAKFWRGRPVFVTGHTGFKGTWLTLWLHTLGAKVTGYSLPPSTQPSLFVEARAADLMTRSIYGDITDRASLAAALRDAEPTVVIHMAAQPLVRESHRRPVETFATNVMGTVHLLEEARSLQPQAILVVTSDKCYRPASAPEPYTEAHPLGGRDPYSASKACAELVTASYRDSFGGPIASARAGNVIGGGDWAADRLVPDLVRARNDRTPLLLRFPNATRPWQHVLEPLAGYLILLEHLAARPEEHSCGWNFGPAVADTRSVADLVEGFEKYWQAPCATLTNDGNLAEAPHLELDSTKARDALHWRTRWGFDETLERTANWYQAFLAGKDARKLTATDLEAYLRT